MYWGHLTGFTVAAGVAAAILLAAPASAQEEPLIGLTDHGELVTFRSTRPSVVSAAVPVTGLGAGETLLAIDRMPDTDRLFGLTATRLYAIDDATAVATPLTAAGAFALSGTAFDMDFVPKEFSIRVISNTGQNIRLSPFTGQLLSTDAPFQFVAGDANAGATPHIVALAHNQNYGGAVAPTMFGLDSDRDLLVRFSSPNGGTMASELPLGFDLSDQAAFDISGYSGHYFLVNTPDGGSVSNVYRLRLAAGKVQFAGSIGGGHTIIDIAAFAVPEPATWAMMVFGFGAIGMTLRKRSIGRSSVPARAA